MTDVQRFTATAGAVALERADCAEAWLVHDTETDTPIAGCLDQRWAEGIAWVLNAPGMMGELREHFKPTPVDPAERKQAVQQKLDELGRW